MGPAGVWTLATWVPCPSRASESSGLQVRERARGTPRATAAGRPPGLGGQVGGPHPHPHQGGRLQPRALLQPLTFCVEAQFVPGFITDALEEEEENGL